MLEQESFSPDWISPPGNTIATALQERGLAYGDLAQKLGVAVEELEQLLRGRLELTKHLAQQLAAALGASVDFWLRREARYREGLDRLNQAAERAVALGWLKEVPASDMVKSGWVEPTSTRADRAVALLRFFGVPTVEAWRAAYRDALRPVAFRASSTLKSQPGAVAAWLRQGELLAASVACDPWSPQRLRARLGALRDLTREKDPAVFLPALRRTCATCGVALVILRTPPGCPASGAVRFLSPHRALVLLSVRFRVDDQFWFTLFHELAHLLLHSANRLILDGDEFLSTKEEGEANDWAASTLIPPEYRAEMFRLPAEAVPVVRFAHKIGIAPGIVVGQLQHNGYLRYDQLNRLKRRYRWAD